jgi:outer membrane lipoprotein-sorting protein
MNRSMRITFAVCILLGFILAGTAAPAQMPQPFSSDLSITTKNGMKVGGKWHFSAPKLRMDMTSLPHSAGNSPFPGNMSIIVDGSSETSYLLMHQQQMYMVFTGIGAHQNPAMNTLIDLNRYQGNPCAGRPDATCKKVGTETVNGRSCDKWEIADKSSGNSTVWIDQKLHFPIKVVGGDGSDVEFTNVKEGAQDASLFVPPSGYSKFDASTMGQKK